VKAYITFKTPDALITAATDAAVAARTQAQEDKLSKDRTKEVSDSAFDEVMKVGELFVRNDEYVTLELDTEAGTCTVIKVK
jgi:hypothetical protein